MEIKIEKIAKQIAKIKQELLEIGNMRPGNLNLQFKNPKEKTGGFYQLNYTHRSKTKTEYVRLGNTEKIKSELEEYQKFKELCDQWVALSIESSKIRSKMP